MIDVKTLPERFLSECKSILGGEFDSFLASYNMEASRALRLNPIRDYVSKFDKRVPWEPLGRYVMGDFKPSGDIAHFSGAYYMQDASAMAAVAALDPKAGERVCDLCASPGGKSGQIAARMAGEGFLLSNEINFSRAKILASNLERMGVSNAYVSSAETKALAEALPAFFDRVLVDAPCSGEGMFRRDPDAIAQWEKTSIGFCAERQSAILRNAAKMVRGGGKLVYSTCTFNRTENEQVIETFLSEYADFEPEDFELTGIGKSINGCMRLFPHRIEGEGHFVAAVKRKGEAINDLGAPEYDAVAERFVERIKSDFVKSVPNGIASLSSGMLCVKPAKAPKDEALGGFLVLKKGLELANADDKRIMLMHALAMAISPDTARECIDLDFANAKMYIAGETISAEADKHGFALVCFGGMSLGWAKCSGGMLKNHLPKGLRMRSTHAFE